MPRVKRGTTSNKHRKNVLKKAKGYRFGRSTKEREAKVALIKAGVSAYRDRRLKKRVNRGLFQIKISAATRAHGLSYSKFMDKLKKSGSLLDRKVLSQLAEAKPATFERLLKQL
ncbi:MAG: 50S ribosomal protein L20 [bacterium]|nr:50S ribosomal protein L20 [bacterium]